MAPTSCASIYTNQHSNIDQKEKLDCSIKKSNLIHQHMLTYALLKQFTPVNICINAYQTIPTSKMHFTSKPKKEIKLSDTYLYTHIYKIDVCEKSVKNVYGCIKD